MKRLIGLLLGADASAEAEMPLASNLTAEIKAWLTPDKLREVSEGWRQKGSGYSDAVIEDLASVLVKPELHYEAILGHLETQFRQQRKASQEYHGLYSWMVELVWDAFKRLKTLEPGANKRLRAEALLDRAATPGSRFRRVLAEDAMALTRIGNSFGIRHFEITQEALTSLDQVDYLFGRMFSFIRMVLSATNSSG